MCSQSGGAPQASSCPQRRPVRNAARSPDITCAARRTCAGGPDVTCAPRRTCAGRASGCGAASGLADRCCLALQKERGTNPACQRPRHRSGTSPAARGLASWGRSQVWSGGSLGPAVQLPSPGVAVAGAGLRQTSRKAGPLQLLPACHCRFH